MKECKLWWRVPYVDNGTGNLCATLISMQANTTDDDSDQQREQPLTTSSIVNAYFLGENALFSSVDFELACYGYRVSLLKKKIQTGRFRQREKYDSNISILNEINRMTRLLFIRLISHSDDYILSFHKNIEMKLGKQFS